MDFKAKKGDVYQFGVSLVPGMTLRDWFAGMVLQGVLANSSLRWAPAAFIAAAYDLADAMMEQRQQDSNPAQRGKEEK